LQRKLISGGYLNINRPTGWFGKMTVSALKKWQQANNLTATGDIGASDRAVLCGGVTAPATQPVVTTPGTFSRPYISSISPQSGPAGTVLTLTGSGFGSASVFDMWGPIAPGFASEHVGMAISSVTSGKIVVPTRGTLDVGNYNVQVVGGGQQIWGTAPTSNMVSFTVTPSSSAQSYIPVLLKDVSGYFSTTANNFVSTSGTIVSVSNNDSNIQILLTDNNSHYLLVTSARAFAGNYSVLIGQLKVGQTITVKGRAGYTNIYNNLGMIGMISLSPQDGIQI